MAGIYTREQLRDQVLDLMDAAGSDRWDRGASGEVDLAIGFAFDREWKRILNANNKIRLQKLSPTTDADGAIVLSALTTNAAGAAATTGNDLRRFYRIIRNGLQHGNRIYEKEDFESYPLLHVQDTQTHRIYYQEGERFRLFPIEANTQIDAMFVNYIPQRPDRLTADNIVPDILDGFEDVLKFEAAAFLLSKGDAEMQAARSFKGYAHEIRVELLQDIKRASTDPYQVPYEDTAGSWGG